MKTKDNDIDLIAQRDALAKKLVEETKRSDDLAKAYKEKEKSLEKRKAELDSLIAGAERTAMATDARYAAELYELKFFSDRVKRLVGSDVDILEKERLTDLFRDFLKNIGENGDNASTAKKVLEKLGDTAFDDEISFDLDEAINPKGELDLKKLCEELGVYQG